MATRGTPPPALSFDQAPPISVPFRFFLTAPLFGVLAGLLLLWQGDAALLSRWAPSTLALVHLVVAGFMLQVMAGALLQFVPVVTGGNVPRPGLLAATVHPALALGVLVLATAFLREQRELFILAALLLGGGGVPLAAALVLALWRAKALGATLGNLRLAALGLLLTLSLGVLLALVVAGYLILPAADLTNIHAVWGLAGWGLLLLAGVSCVVVPMFQMTGGYPGWVVHAVRYLVAVAAVAILLPLVSEVPPWIGVGAALVAAAVYALATLRLQARRRRRVPDHVLYLFRLGMGSVLVAAVVTIGLLVLAPQDGRWTVLVGILVIYGLFVSVLLGMLYKVVPFLVWLHLQALPGMKASERAGGKATHRPRPPDMNQMIPPAWARTQRWLHLVTLLVLAVAPWDDFAARLGGGLVVTSSLLLWSALVRAAGVYRRFGLALRSRIRADAVPTEC